MPAARTLRHQSTSGPHGSGCSTSTSRCSAIATGAPGLDTVAGSIGARAANPTTGVRYSRPLLRPTWCTVAHGGTREEIFRA